MKSAVEAQNDDKKLVEERGDESPPTKKQQLDAPGILVVLKSKFFSWAIFSSASMTLTEKREKKASVNLVLKGREFLQRLPVISSIRYGP